MGRHGRTHAGGVHGRGEDRGRGGTGLCRPDLRDPIPMSRLRPDPAEGRAPDEGCERGAARRHRDHRLLAGEEGEAPGRRRGEHDWGGWIHTPSMPSSPFSQPRSGYGACLTQVDRLPPARQQPRPQLPTVQGTRAGGRGGRCSRNPEPILSLYNPAPLRMPCHPIPAARMQVTFGLHSSFANPSRDVDYQPYELTEVGWGEFDITIRVGPRWGVAEVSGGRFRGEGGKVGRGGGALASCGAGPARGSDTPLLARRGMHARRKPNKPETRPGRTTAAAFRGRCARGARGAVPPLDAVRCQRRKLRQATGAATKGPGLGDGS